MGMIEKPNSEEFLKNLKFESIIDVKAIQSLMDDFYDLTNIGIAILDLEGKVLVAKGWQDICIKFHRVHPETLKNCMESDLELSKGIEPGNFKLYRCKNNMLDMATPIAVGGHKIGNLYLGQFLFEDESVNVETFRLQAQKFGFEEDLYIEALEKVPRWSRQTVNTVMDFYTKFAGLISELGYKNLELNRSVREKESLLDKLKESENKYRELVENLNYNESEKQAILDASIDVIILVDAELKIIWANKTAAGIIDRHPDDLIGHTCHQLFQNSDSPCPGCPTLEAFISGKPSHKTMYQPHMKGIGESYWEDYCVPVKDESGRVMGAVEIARNVTDRHKDEKILRASEEKFSKAFRNAPLLMAITALENGCYLEVNEAFVRATGYTRKEVIGRTSTELGLIAVEDRQKLLNLLNPERRIKDLEIQLTCADGSKRTCLFSGETIEYEGKRRLLSNAVDITYRKQSEAERERLQAQLLQAQKMESVGRLAGGVAHDFNNNLAVIQGYTQMMLEDINPEDSHHGELEQILNAANRSAALTRQLLAFARKQTISPKLLDLNDTVEGMLKMLRRLIGENIELIWRPGPNLWTIKMDPAQVDQVLANLCVNARDAIEDVGKLTIETRNVVMDKDYCSTHTEFLPGQYAMLALSDDGSGMDKATLEQIFEPFFTTKEVGKGTGLGLSTIYGILKQNGGFTNVYSEPRKGTTFKIYIPRYHGDMTQNESGRPEKIAKGHGETILLVEDDAGVLNLSKMMLERLGYGVFPTTKPDEAIEMVREHTTRIHLLMTDVVMPQMSGKDLAGQITEIHPDIQTLFMSGYTANVIAHQGILDEGVNFIEKPFSMNELGRKIREALKKEENTKFK